MDTTTLSILIVFIVYIIGMIAVGLFFSRKKLSNAEYVLAGRSLNPWVVAMSAQASDMSGWLLTGLPGLAFASILGAKEAIYTAIGLLLGTFLNWFFTARRLRVYTEVSNNSLTMSSYLSNRFKEKSGVLKVLTALVICVFFTVYAASMFSASATLFSTVFNVDYFWALVIGVIVIVAYVMLGGFFAVSWTDFFQGVLMFFALIIVPILCYQNLTDTGVTTISSVFSDVMNLIPDDSANSFGWIGIAGAIGWGLGYFGMPHILVRFMAIEDHKKLKPSMVIAIIWTAVTLFASIIIGILAQELVSVTDSESVFLAVVMKLFNPIIAGILLSAVLAAIMSTADSQLLVASSSFSNDVYGFAKQKFGGKTPTDKEYMFVSRLTVVILSIIAFLIAMDENSSIFSLVQYAWGGLGAAFGPVMLFSLYSKKLNKYGAIASISVGVIVTIVFKYFLAPMGGLWAIYELVPGFICSTIALFVVSYATKRFEKIKDMAEISFEFEKMTSIIKEK